MDKKTIQIDGQDYVIAPLTFGQGKALFSGDQAKEINTPLLIHSLNNADEGIRTEKEINALPYRHAMELLPECLDINGMRPEKAVSKGEPGPALAAPE